MTKRSHFSKTAISLMIAMTLVAAPQLASANASSEWKTPEQAGVISPVVTTAIPKTAPPPVMVQPMAIFDGYTYLKSSTVSLISNSNQTMTFKAITNANSTVSYIGGNIQFQEWNGSSWINLIPTSSYSASNSTVAQGESSKATKSGYYYRVKVVHTVTHNGTTESITEYSGSYLAN